MNDHFYDLEPGSKLHEIWEEKIKSSGGFKCEPLERDYRWLVPGNNFESCRNALIISMQSHLINANQYESSAKEWRDFFMAIMGYTPYATANRQMLDLVAFAIQLAGVWDPDERIALHQKFVTNTRKDK